MSPKSVSCPTCQRSVEWSPDSPWRPFCSERCKLIDLGAWVSEQRAIPGEQLPSGGQVEDDVGEKGEKGKRGRYPEKGTLPFSQERKG